MIEVQAATSIEAAQWLFRIPVEWSDLVRYGPPEFDAYLRIAFRQHPTDAPLDGEDPGLRSALEVLAAHTATPTVGYAAVWEGWTSEPPPDPAPRVYIPNRTMLLFTGPVNVLRDAPALAWRAVGRIYQEPHLVWPKDRAWCLACDVDEEIEFSAGCDDEAARALLDRVPGARRVPYGEVAPPYSDSF